MRPAAEVVACSCKWSLGMQSVTKAIFSMVMPCPPRRVAHVLVRGMERGEVERRVLHPPAVGRSSVNVGPRGNAEGDGRRRHEGARRRWAGVTSTARTGTRVRQAWQSPVAALATDVQPEFGCACTRKYGNMRPTECQNHTLWSQNHNRRTKMPRGMRRFGIIRGRDATSQVRQVVEVRGCPVRPLSIKR